MGLVMFLRVVEQQQKKMSELGLLKEKRNKRNENNKVSELWRDTLTESWFYFFTLLWSSCHSELTLILLVKGFVVVQKVLAWAYFTVKYSWLKFSWFVSKATQTHNVGFGNQIQVTRLSVKRCMCIHGFITPTFHAYISYISGAIRFTLSLRHLCSASNALI